MKAGDIIVVKPVKECRWTVLSLKGTRLWICLSHRRVAACGYNPDDTVLSGSINTFGMLKLQVEKPYNQSTVAGILDLVEECFIKKSQDRRG